MLNRPPLAQSQQLSVWWSSFGTGRFAGWMSSRQWTDEAWHRWMRLIWRPPCKAIFQVSAVTENIYHKLLHMKSKYLFVYCTLLAMVTQPKPPSRKSYREEGYCSTWHEDVRLSDEPCSWNVSCLWHLQINTCFLMQIQRGLLVPACTFHWCTLFEGHGNSYWV